MRVTNTFVVGGDDRVQKVVCDKCGITGTVHVVVLLVNVKPGRGEGAAAIAKKLREQRALEVKTAK